MHFVQAKERMVKMVSRIIEERKKVLMDNNVAVAIEDEEEKKGGAVNDVVDVLLRDKGESHSSPSLLTPEMISENIIEMMIPGEETLPTAMTMALHFLSHTPLALSKLLVPTFICVFYIIYIITILSPQCKLFKHN